MKYKITTHLKGKADPKKVEEYFKPFCGDGGDFTTYCELSRLIGSNFVVKQIITHEHEILAIQFVLLLILASQMNLHIKRIDVRPYNG